MKRLALVLAFLLIHVRVFAAPQHLMQGSCEYDERGTPQARFCMLDGKPYAKHLTLEDVRQIVQLAKDRPDVLKPVDQIIVDHPGEAEVHTGDPRTTGDRGCTFRARKREG